MQKDTIFVTKNDLKQLETSIKEVLNSKQPNQMDQRYLDLLEKIVETLNEIRLTVEFEHERRLQAIEEFLQDM